MKVILATSLFLLFIGPVAIAAPSCLDAFAFSEKQLQWIKPLLSTDFPLITKKIREDIESGTVNIDKTYFVVLPGNMGHFWRGTNHNVGYDLLPDLIRHYEATGQRSLAPSSGRIVETKTFDTKEAGDDTSFVDRQSFYSEAPFARTESGEVFYAQTADGRTLIFLRRYGFYNDGANFFVPFVKAVGGKTENIVIIHDELSAPVGQLRQQSQRVEYHGNRAILSLHNNLNASRLQDTIETNKGSVEGKILEGLPSSLVTDSAMKTLLWEIQLKTWEEVVEVKNQADPVVFNSQLSRALREPLIEFYNGIKAALQMRVSKQLETLNQARASIRTAENKKEAAETYRELMDKMINESAELSQYFLVEARLKDLGGKKSPFANELIEIFAKDFDPRVLESPFYSIGIGTGYQKWFETGSVQGFSEIPSVLKGVEPGSYPHFVLAPRDPYFDNSLFPKRIIGMIEALTTTQP